MAPTTPEIADRLVVAGVGNTVKVAPLDCRSLRQLRSRSLHAGHRYNDADGAPTRRVARVPLNVTVLLAETRHKFALESWIAETGRCMALGPDRAAGLNVNCLRCFPWKLRGSKPSAAEQP